MPTWYLDLKIPLVQTRYQMSDISDTTSGIFLTDDSLGFKIIQEGEMPGTPLPDFAPVPIGMDQSISSGEIPGISLDINLPGISIDQRIDDIQNKIDQLSNFLENEKNKLREPRNIENPEN